MKSISYLSLILTFLLVLASCKKDSNEKDLTPNGILTSHGWKISSYSQIDLNLKETIYTPTSCESDDYTIFKSDDTYKLSRGSIKCTQSETDKTGTWSLSDDGKTFSLDGLSYSILTLETTTFVIKYSIGAAGFKYSYIPN